MQTGNLELIITLVSIVGAILTAFGFLHREMRRGFDRVDRRFDRVDRRFDRVDRRFDRQDAESGELRTDVTDLKVSVARIEGHLGIGVPSSAEPRAGDGPPERAA